MGLYPRFRHFTLETFIDVLVSTLQPDLKHPVLFSNRSLMLVALLVTFPPDTLITLSPYPTHILGAFHHGLLKYF